MRLFTLAIRGNFFHRERSTDSLAYHLAELFLLPATKKMINLISLLRFLRLVVLWLSTVSTKRAQKKRSEERERRWKKFFQNKLIWKGKKCSKGIRKNMQFLQRQQKNFCRQSQVPFSRFPNKIFCAHSSPALSPQRCFFFRSLRLHLSPTGGRGKRKKVFSSHSLPSLSPRRCTASKFLLTKWGASRVCEFRWMSKEQQQVNWLKKTPESPERKGEDNAPLSKNVNSICVSVCGRAGRCVQSGRRERGPAVEWCEWSEPMRSCERCESGNLFRTKKKRRSSTDPK